MYDTGGHDFISAFLRDSLRIGASAWIVTNVMRIWTGHGVPASAIVAALDEVAAEHPLDPERIGTYRGAIVDLLSGGSQVTIPPQRRHLHGKACRLPTRHRADTDPAALR